MDFKKTKASAEIITRDLEGIAVKTGNLYESIVVILKRSNQISREIKEELDQKLNEFASTSDNLDEVFENREQIEISRYYESLPKSTAISIEEFKDNKTYFRNPDKEGENGHA